MYDQELYDTVSTLYKADLQLYKNKCNADLLLNRENLKT